MACACFLLSISNPRQYPPMMLYLAVKYLWFLDFLPAIKVYCGMCMFHIEYIRTTQCCSDYYIGPIGHSTRMLSSSYLTSCTWLSQWLWLYPISRIPDYDIKMMKFLISIQFSIDSDLCICQLLYFLVFIIWDLVTPLLKKFSYIYVSKQPCP